MENLAALGTRSLRACSPRGLLLVALVAAAALIAFAPGGTEGASGFNVDGKVTKLRIVYDGVCNPGQLATGNTIQLGESIDGANNKVVALTAGTGNVSGCFGLDASPSTAIINEELFTYSTIAAQLTVGIDDVVNGVPISVSDLSGQNATDFPERFPLSGGQMYIENELVNFTRSGSTITISSGGRAQGGTSADEHLAGSLIRLNGWLRLKTREEEAYVGGPGTDPQQHDPTDAVSSPKTYLTCRGRLAQTSQSGNDAVFSRSRCVAMLEPGHGVITGNPSNPAWWPDGWPMVDGLPADPAADSNMPVLPLSFGFYHDLSTGTIDEGAVTSTTPLTLTTDFLGFQCFPIVEEVLWLKLASTINVDKTTMDEDYGQFRVEVHGNSTCTDTQFTMGDQDAIPLQSTGTNLASYEIATTVDSDGDFCEDYKELGDNLNAGGLRDPFNYYDYFEPTHNSQVRAADISFVVDHFFIDDDDLNPGLPPYEPGYSPDSDRSVIGPSLWNLGRGNGQVRAADISLVVKQFFNDC